MRKHIQPISHYSPHERIKILKDTEMTVTQIWVHTFRSSSEK